MMYAIQSTTSSATAEDRWLRPSEAPDVWYLRPVEEPEIESEVIATGMTNSLLDEIERAASTSADLERALVHGANTIARLATQREGDRVQVTASFIVKGAGVTRHYARRALDILRRVLVARHATIIFQGKAHRCFGSCGWFTLIPEAFAACIRVIDTVGAPEPKVGGFAATGRKVLIRIPAGRLRGKTRCPCSAHKRGDQRDTLAYDVPRGRATCQYSLACFGLDDDGEWSELRAPWPHRERSKRETTAATGPVPTGNLPYRRGWFPDLGVHELVTLKHVVTHPGHAPEVRRSNSVPSFHGRHAFEIAWFNASRRFCGPAEERKAKTYAQIGDEYHLRGGRIERCLPDWEATRWAWRGDERLFPIKVVYSAVGTDLVLFDIDGLDPRDTEPDEAEVKAILRTVANTELTVATITRTSRTGVQVVCRLPGFAPDVQALYRDLRVRRMLEDVGKRIRQAINRGGHVDPSAWAPGRLARRPGWRTAKDGSAVCARLAWTSVHGFLG